MRPKVSRGELLIGRLSLGSLIGLWVGVFLWFLCWVLGGLVRLAWLRRFLRGVMGFTLYLRSVVRRTDLYERLSEGLSERVSRIRRLLEVLGVFRWRGSVLS